MKKENQPNTLGRYLADQEERGRKAELEGRPGRRRRLKTLITTSRIEGMLGFKPKKIPEEIRSIVNKRLPETALIAIWYSPNIFLWRDESDPLVYDTRLCSPFEMWKENKYRETVEDFMRVMVDSLES